MNTQTAVTAVGLFDSESYNDIMDVALCQAHHAQLRCVLDLPRWDAESVDDYSECECCTDADALSEYHAQFKRNNDQ